MYSEITHITIRPCTLKNVQVHLVLELKTQFYLKPVQFIKYNFNKQGHISK